MVVLSTAHAAKFPDAVFRATGLLPAQPDRLRLKLGETERCTTMPSDFAAVANFITATARASRVGVRV
jgi:threonine synthase